MIYILYILISFIIGGSAFLASSNLIMALVVMGLFLVYFLIFFDRNYRKNKHVIKRYHECYIFINDFVIAYAVKGSLSGALEGTTLSQSEELKKYMTGIEHLEVEERVKYLKEYFPFDIYGLFLNILSLNIEQGGDVLDAFKHLMKKSREIEEDIINIENKSKHKLIEISVLWALTITVLVAMRFALSQFFKLIINKPFYFVAVCIFYVLLLFFTAISLKTIFTIRVKGYRPDAA